VYPESDSARQFSNLVQTFVQSGYKDQAVETQIRSWLTRWRDNHAKLNPLLSGSFLLEEDVPLSQDLSTLGTAGLQALDYYDKGTQPPDDWKKQQAATIEQIKKSRAGLLLMVAAPVEQLIDSNGAGR
jgi:hexosaminidase